MSSLSRTSKSFLANDQARFCGQSCLSPSFLGHDPLPSPTSPTPSSGTVISTFSRMSYRLEASSYLVPTMSTSPPTVTARSGSPSFLSSTSIFSIPPVPSLPCLNKLVYSTCEMETLKVVRPHSSSTRSVSPCLVYYSVLVPQRLSSSLLPVSLKEEGLVLPLSPLLFGSSSRSFSLPCSAISLLSPLDQS